MVRVFLPNPFDSLRYGIRSLYCYENLRNIAFRTPVEDIISKGVQGGTVQFRYDWRMSF